MTSGRYAGEKGAGGDRLSSLRADLGSYESRDCNLLGRSQLDERERSTSPSEGEVEVLIRPTQLGMRAGAPPPSENRTAFFLKKDKQ